MILKDFIPFLGQHCETTATGSLLKHIGIELSEAMLFGLGEGLGFIYWDMKSMNFPFLGGRIKPDLITKNVVHNLGLELRTQETSSKTKAWEQVRKNIDNRIPVGLKLDCYHLDYFTHKFHFGAHYVTMYGYDQKYAYLVDTIQQGSTTKATLKNLELSRNEKGPMASKNLSYTISGINHIELTLRNTIVEAIQKNAKDFLNPSIKNKGYKGIKKTSTEVKKWFQRSANIPEDFQKIATLMERGGTGGALFRNLYRDFLKESLTIMNNKNLEKAYHIFCEVASLWTNVATLIHRASISQNEVFLHQASEILLDLAAKEKIGMELLSTIEM